MAAGAMVCAVGRRAKVGGSFSSAAEKFVLRVAGHLG